MLKNWLILGATVLLLISCHGRVRLEQVERGGEWLSWTPTERARYVSAYLDGYLGGRLQACEVADKLFEVGMPHRLGDDQHATEVPSGRCLAEVNTFSRFKFTNSRLDVSAYTNPITEFYTKHPEYNGVPFPFLLQSLSDKGCSTSDDLYQMARSGKLHVVR
jgi:hypothetical protein